VMSRLVAQKKEISNLVRERQDAAKKWQILDESLTKSFSETAENQNNKPDPTIITSIQKIRAQLKSLDNELENLFPKFFEISSVRPLSLSDTQDLLGLGEGLFTFVSDDETASTYAFMVTKEDARAYKVDLSESEIADIVGELRSDIDLSQVVGIGDLPNFDMNISYELYSKLFGPAEDMLEGVEHLLVVPTGPMESLPLNLLVTEKPEIDPSSSVFDNYQAAAWLPKSYSLTRLPSVSSLRALRVFASADQAQEPFIGFGDPVLNGQPSELRGLQIANVYRGKKADIEQVRSLPELPETSE
jgi:hypothetical protein